MIKEMVSIHYKRLCIKPNKRRTQKFDSNSEDMQKDAPKMIFLDLCEKNRKRNITSHMQRLYCIGEQKIQWLHKAK